LIERFRDCSPAAVREHARYLKATPVAAVGVALELGELSLARGVFTSIKGLGSLKTEFGDLDGLSAQAEHGQGKFMVRQVLPALLDPRCTDSESLMSVEHFMALDERNELIPLLVVTLLSNDGSYQIKDGNKRAVAFYEGRKLLDDDAIFLPVYVAFWA
jgi:hypothetical protein